jgi:hypothetical protein
VTTSTLGQHAAPVQTNTRRPAFKARKENSIFVKIVRALSCEPQGIDAATLGYEVTPIVHGKTAAGASPADVVVDSPRFTMMDALVIEGLATGFVRF